MAINNKHPFKFPLNSIDDLAPLLPPLPTTLSINLFPSSLLNEASAMIGQESFLTESFISTDSSPSLSFSSSSSSSYSSSSPSHPPLSSLDWSSIQTSTSEENEILTSTVNRLRELHPLFDQVATLYDESLAEHIHDYPCQYQDTRGLARQAQARLAAFKALEESVEHIRQAQEVVSSLHSK